MRNDTTEKHARGSDKEIELLSVFMTLMSFCLPFWLLCEGDSLD